MVQHNTMKKSTAIDTSNSNIPVVEIVFPQMTSNVPAFLGKLWKMVDDPETDHLIAWSDDGNSFIIYNQAEFAQALLPYYYKHSNMASFVRQLNMYGFHKVVGVDSGGLKSERQEEMEFAHPCFLRGHEEMLDQIRRKVASKQTPTSFVPSIRPEKVNEVLHEVSQLRDKQDDMDTKLDTMKKENEALWREVVNLRQKHSSQQKIVNKLIQFLMSVVQPRMGNAVKRRYQPQLAIEDSALLNSGLGGSKIARMDENLDLNFGQDNINKSLGPVIQEVTQDSLIAEDFLFETSQSPAQEPTVESPMSPLSAAVMQAVDPTLVSSAVRLRPASPRTARNAQASPRPSPRTVIVPDLSEDTNENPDAPTAVITHQMRPSLQREISKEDFDFETNSMQRDLDNLKEMLSGQITFDTNILTNIFNPDEPLASYFGSSSGSPLINDFSGAQKLSLKLEGSELESNTDDLMNQNQPLFDISGIDDETDDLNTPSKNDELMNIDDFSDSLNTPIVIFDPDESPVVTQIRYNNKFK